MTAPPSKSPRTCSQCGHNGHNARTCSEHSVVPPSHTTGFRLFGVTFNAVDSSLSPSPPFSPSSSSSSGFRKSFSMNNLCQYEQQHQDQQQQHIDSSSQDVVSSGYNSDDALHASASRTRDRERKRGIPWTEEEHRLFLLGLDKVGKGDWRGISRNFVKTRTPTQVASHAQKYFLRRTNLNRRRRRSSLFDITTDTVSRSASESQLSSLDSTQQTTPFPSPYPSAFSTKQGRSLPLLPVPPSSKMACLNLNQLPTTSSPSSSSTSTYSPKERECEPLLSLKLAQGPGPGPGPPLDEESSRRSPTFRGFDGSKDSIISVA
ncbi:transcription factor KUA1-like [Chenopodium quinoa]|uniref:transcription factor KUA1-like n=1 Tax=Chenopodium quinoa TaxID=63459 RepID=UPI000B786CA4|nr:transcription factor KUA1-like [Chenopodium quinoa]